MKKWQVIALVCLGVVILGTGGYFIYQKFTEPKVSVGKVNPINPILDVVHSKSFKATAAGGGAISVYDENKVGTLVEVPAGALEKDSEIRVVPLKIKDANDQPGIAILPDNLVFKKPVIISFDYSLSKVKNAGAPENAMGNDVRVSGASHIYRYNIVSTSFSPQLVNRAAETKEILSAEIQGGGFYFDILNDSEQIERAQYVLSLKDQTVPTTLEAANTLYSNEKKISGKAKDLVTNAVIRVKADKTPDVIELQAALEAEKSLKNKKLSSINTAEAADTYGQLLETICKDPATGFDQLLSSWKTAQLAGENAAAENCKTRVQNDIAKKVNALLDQPDPTYVDLLKASKDVELAGLEDKFDEAIAKKRHDKAVREAEELLKDSSVSPEVLTIALQNLNLFVDDKPDLTQAVQDRIMGGLSTDVQRVLNDPNATKQDIERAIAKNSIAGGGEETRKKLEEKLKNAKEGSDNKVDNTATEQVTEEEPAFDLNTMLAAALMQAMGLNDFSAGGIQAWGDQTKQQLEEMRDWAIAMCELGNEIGAAQDCGALASQMDSALSQFDGAVSDAAENVGEIQALPEDQVDNEYDGENGGELSGECISKEEADQIDPERKLDYTICPDTEANPATDQGDDQSDSDLQESEDGNAQPEDNSSDNPASTDNSTSDSNDSENQ